MSRCCLVAALIACTLVSVFAQKPEPAAVDLPESQDQDVVRISVRLVQVDGTVTDKEGRQVTDLKKEDFELFVDGRRQDISNFSYIAAQPGTAPAVEARK